MIDLKDVQRAYDATASAYHEHLPDLRAEQPVERALIASFFEHRQPLTMATPLTQSDSLKLSSPDVL